ncbi:MAG TPA: phosphoenolpyruvate synthase [Anaerolineales bacterium]|nr:phosphoenolpyruvate synthase [Anaerolineales bacterium]
MNNTPIILPFNKIRASDLPLVGGKGANLGEMTHAGFPIPGGFCLTTAAFRQFMDAHQNYDDIYQQLESIAADDVESVREVEVRIRETLMNVSMPDEIANAVKGAWQETGIEHAYAVRSSATAEDLPDASFAGQQDTYLNIIGEESLLDAIRRCWASLFTDRAILYRVQNNFPHREVALSVVVQQMVMSEKSGTLFTADPLTGHRHTLTIDASFGLGEALVNGLVTPDSYRVDKRTRVILDRQIADKQIGIFPEKDGGTRQETLSAAQRKQTVLSDEQILALTDLGFRIEAHYGTPLDIEWAITGDDVHLLQARPITSLFPIDGLKSPDDSLHIYFSMGHQQNMIDAMAPLSISNMQNVIPLGRKEKGGSTVLVENAGRIFLDATPVLRHPILHRGMLVGMSQLDALAPQALRIAMQRPEFQHPHNLPFSFSTVKTAFGFFKQVMHALWRRDYTGFLPQVNTIISAYIEETKSKLSQTSIGKEQTQIMVVALQNAYKLLLNWIAPLIAGVASTRVLPRLGRKLLTPEELDALTLGLSGNVVTEMNLALGDLADLARRSPELVEWFGHLGSDSQNWLEKAAKLENSAPFIEALVKFLADYGSRGLSEIDIMLPKWYEEPISLLKVIASYLKKEEGSHRVQEQKLIEARESATKKLLAGSKGLKKRLAKRLIYVMTHTSILREHHKFAVIQVLRVAKEMLKKMAVQLVEINKLAHTDDIWFLNWYELLQIWDAEPGTYANLASERRAAFPRYQKLIPPLVITSDGETPIVKYEVADAPPGALVGDPVSMGVFEGIVHVIHNPQTESLKPGEILVAPFTDPGWTPLFINAGALIMEVGGRLTHGSVVAREYGIPAVVGVRDATKELQTGQRVRVDGNRGVIETL